MTCNADTHRIRVALFEDRFEESLVGGINIEFFGIRGLLPVVHFGLDLLHREVGTFHDANLDRRTSTTYSVIRPFA